MVCNNRFKIVTIFSVHAIWKYIIVIVVIFCFEKIDGLYNMDCSYIAVHFKQ